MLKHQKRFLEMERRIDSGEFLLKDLDVAMESYDQASDWLVAVENGNQDALDVVLKIHGHEISHEGISLEGVQVHINSAQTQAVIDFLKKWIPKILKMIRDVVTQFFKWVMQKLHDTGEKIKRAKARLLKSAVKEIRLGPECSKATLSLIDGHSYCLDNVSTLQFALSWVSGIETSATLLDNGTLGDFKIYIDSISEWLTLDSKSELFSATKLGWDPNNSEVTMLHAINNLPSISDALVQANESLGKRYATQSINPQLTIGRDKALKRLDEFDNVQLKLIGGCKNVEKILAATSRNLEVFVGQRTTDMSPIQTTALNVAVRTSRYALNATTRGLQWRLGQIRKAIDALSAFDPIEA